MHVKEYTACGQQAVYKMRKEIVEYEMDREFQKEDMDELYKEFQREMNALEERRDNITREIREIDTEQSILDDIYVKMRWLFKEAAEHCDEEGFLREMEWREDDFYDCRRKIENELEEEKELLETEKRNSYRKEEELRDEFQRAKQCLIGGKAWD